MSERLTRYKSSYSYSYSYSQGGACLEVALDWQLDDLGRRLWLGGIRERP
ncbi:hypothetical protein [Streptomyces pactum]|nr:hypothetical protein [Streptomyces pactum]